MLFIELGVNTLFGLFIYIGVVYLKDYHDKKILILFIIIFLIINYLINLLKEEKELKRLKKQVKIYAHTFIVLDAAYKEALKNIKARDEFLSIVSHELKTPLTVMLLNLHSLLKSVQNDSMASFSIHELVKILKNSELQIKWLKAMINDLLDVSLVTTGRMDLQKENTDLLAITKQVTQSFSELLKKDKIKIKIQAKSSVYGKWDKVRIEQAISNLVSNAIKYGEGKPIDIQITKKGDKGKFIIRDEGIGIAHKEQKNIFDLFKRASGPDKYKKGLGVGLFITSQIVNIHQGKIKVSSSLGKGTRFTIELPLKK